MTAVEPKVVADAPAPVCELSSFERLGVWCGLVGCILAFAGILIAHLFPPPSPDETAEQVAHFYRTYTTEVRWGTIIAAYGSALLAPWFGVMVVRMRQFPGYGRAMAYCQAGLAAVLILEFIYPLVMLQVVVFRPDRPAAETLTLSDFALIFFIAPGYTPVVEFLFMGLAILRDRGRVPVFPRWSGWLCIVTAILTLPAAAVILTKTGPWRWSGFFGWWVPAIAFGVWFMAMTVTMLRPPRPAAS